jgi:isopenicillin-N N-acyltransferase-like protein
MEVAPLPALNRQFTSYRLDVVASPRNEAAPSAAARVS